MSHGHDVGDLIRAEMTFKNEAGVPTNPSVVTLVVRAPDGSETTPTPTNPSAGVWRHEWVPDQGGNWLVRWKGTGTVTDAEEERFYVRPKRTTAG